MNIREIALDRVFAEPVPRPETVQVVGDTATKPIVLIDEPGLQVTEYPAVPDAFLSPEELRRREIEHDPLPNIAGIIARRYADLGTKPKPYVQ